MELNKTATAIIKKAKEDVIYFRRKSTCTVYPRQGLY